MNDYNAYLVYYYFFWATFCLFTTEIESLVFPHATIKENDCKSIQMGI